MYDRKIILIYIYAVLKQAKRNKRYFPSLIWRKFGESPLKLRWSLASGGTLSVKGEGFLLIVPRDKDGWGGTSQKGPDASSLSPPALFTQKQRSQWPADHMSQDMTRMDPKQKGPFSVLQSS